MAFAHLHVHSSASDGLASPTDLAKAAAELGYTHLALTDHNTLSGLEEFHEACTAHHVTPIYGVELRVRSASGMGHALVLGGKDAANVLRELILRFRAPTVRDLEWACGYAELPVYVTSACLGGEVASALRTGDWWTARDVAREYQEALGTRYYLEVQPSFGAVLPWIVSLAHEMGIPVVGTNDVHYLTNAQALDGERSRLNLDLASEEQLRTRVPLSTWQQAMDGAMHLAELLTAAPASEQSEYAAVFVDEVVEPESVPELVHA